MLNAKKILQEDQDQPAQAHFLFGHWEYWQ